KDRRQGHRDVVRASVAVDGGNYVGVALVDSVDLPIREDAGNTRKRRGPADVVDRQLMSVRVARDGRRGVELADLDGVLRQRDFDRRYPRIAWRRSRITARHTGESQHHTNYFHV